MISTCKPTFGMSYHLVQDYRHDLICHTEREKFIVPVYATGVRGILDFPDEIHFSVCPVKYSNTKSLLIRNIGNGDAKFKLEVKGLVIFCMNEAFMHILMFFKAFYLFDYKHIKKKT